MDTTPFPNTNLMHPPEAIHGKENIKVGKTYRRHHANGWSKPFTVKRVDDEKMYFEWDNPKTQAVLGDNRLYFTDAGVEMYLPGKVWNYNYTVEYTD